MNLAANANQRLEDFRIEDAEDVRQHNPVIDELLAYFEEKTQRQRLARREDLKPMELKDELPKIGLFEPIYNGEGQLVDADITLLGSRLDEFYGHMTGKRVNEFPQAQVAVRIIQACRQCVALKKPIVVQAESLSDVKNFLSITVLYVPMSSDGETVDRIFLHNQITSKFPTGKKR